MILPCSFHQKRPVLWGAALFLLCLGAPAEAAWWWPFGAKGINYAVVIEGIDKKTRDWFHVLKLDEKKENNPPQTEEELKQESISLKQGMMKALATKGFYDALIRDTIQKKEKTTVLHYAVHPGPRYAIRSVQLTWEGKPLRTIAVSDIKTKKHDKIDAVLIEKDAADLLKKISEKSCFVSLEVSPLLQLYGRDHTAALVMRIRHGMSADFGKTTIQGNRTVKDAIILRSVQWKQGECYRQEKVDQTVNNLIQNQLLSSAKVTPGNKVDAKGQVPMHIDVTERVPRTISAGANYSTDQGFGVTGGWEHRNFFGNAEKMTIDATVAQKEQELNSNLRFPNFYRGDQSLVLSFGVEREDQDAYTVRSITTGASVERRLTQQINAGLGISYALMRTDDVLTGKSEYGLLSFPGFLDYDTRDDLLDPHKGLWARAAVTPYTETFGDGGQFLKSEGTVQAYISAPMSFDPTLALKASLGTITGAEGIDVPSNIRFYAGGGGSVRGYSYQSLGPRTDKKPAGGSSMATGSGEIRFRFNETYGAVAFVDAGNAYEEDAPDIGEKLYYGAGVGMRYFSAIGPLRLDVAFPLNGKDIGETGFAVYVSIGQSF